MLRHRSSSWSSVAFCQQLRFLAFQTFKLDDISGPPRFLAGSFLDRLCSLQSRILFANYETARKEQKARDICGDAVSGKVCAIHAEKQSGYFPFAGPVSTPACGAWQHHLREWSKGVDFSAASTSCEGSNPRGANVFGSRKHRLPRD